MTVYLKQLSRTNEDVAKILNCFYETLSGSHEIDEPSLEERAAIVNNAVVELDRDPLPEYVKHAFIQIDNYIADILAVFVEEAADRKESLNDK